MNTTPTQSRTNQRHFDVDVARRDFPILASRIHGYPLVYLDKRAVFSFVVDGAHPQNIGIGTILDHEGIAVRTGHHCAQPVMDRFGIPATTRISLGLYSTRDDVDAAVQAIAKANEVFRC